MTAAPSSSAPRVRRRAPRELARPAPPRRRRRGTAAVRPDAAPPAASVAAPARELLQVERVASAVAVDRVRARADQLARLGLVERTERDEAVLRCRLPVLRGGSWPGSGRDREEDRAGGRAVDERAEDVERGGVGPVDVVEADDQWARRGQPLEQVAERAVGAVAVGARRPAQRPAPAARRPARPGRRARGATRVARPPRPGGGRAPRSRARRAGRPRTPTRAPRAPCSPRPPPAYPSSRDLPMPASPSSTSSPAAPPRSEASAASIASRSRARPIRGWSTETRLLAG